MEIGLLQTARNRFKRFVLLDDYKVFYHFAKMMPKSDLATFFKTLAIQEMGGSTIYHLPDDPARQDEIPQRKYAMAISAEKAFSAARDRRKNNVFFQYYTMILAMNKKDMEDAEAFKKFLQLYCNQKHKPVYHKIRLPKQLKITASNTDLYTRFELSNYTYQTSLGVCSNGFFFIIDAFSGETMKAFAIPRDQGEPIATSYCDHTVRIVFERGGVCVINLLLNVVEEGRLVDVFSRITFFKDYYPEYSIMVKNERTINIMRGLRSKKSITLTEELKAKAAFLIFDERNDPDRMVVAANNEKGHTVFFLIDPRAKEIVHFTMLYDTVASFEQDLNGDIYIETTKGGSFLLWRTEEDTLSIDYSDIKAHFMRNGEGLTSREDGKNSSMEN